MSSLIHTVPLPAPTAACSWCFCPSAATKPVVRRHQARHPPPPSPSSARRGVFRGLAANASWRCRPPRLRAAPSSGRLRQYHSQLSVSLWRNIPAGRVLCAADDEGEYHLLLPSSCRYVPTCSEYSVQAYKQYGVAKGTILTAWRLCRCNPLGGYGYDPPRWFGDEDVPLQ